MVHHGDQCLAHASKHLNKLAERTSIILDVEWAGSKIVTRNLKTALNCIPIATNAACEKLFVAVKILDFAAKQNPAPLAFWSSLF